jgi:hypothetical protein
MIVELLARQSCAHATAEADNLVITNNDRLSTQTRQLGIDSNVWVMMHNCQLMTTTTRIQIKNFSHMKLSTTVGKHDYKWK